MFNITGYTITQILYESANSIIYRGVRADNNQAVILKTLRADYPTPRQISQFKNEYEFTKELNIPGIRHVIETVNIGNKPVLILEYVDGVTLKEAFVKQSPSFPNFIKAAIQITQIMGDMHHRRIIHKDINPNNILIDPQHKTITIIDFGIASKLNLKTPHLGNPDLLEGTLSYMSPEQSGRINRTVDFRTDLYSLGATLYACLAGRPPFEHDDPLALIHAHIAKLPTPPVDLIGPDSSLFALNHAVLQALSDVIMKLLAKKAGDRYQSALGVRRDLEQIAAMLEAPQAVFQLGRDDVSEQFLMPETLYGREHEIDLLLKTFRDLTGFGNLPGLQTSALALVSGSAGIGKSALVAEIHTPMTEQHSYFIQGKFDQYQRNIPYFALTQALNQFCRYLLSERDATLTAWRETILQVVGENGQVLIDIIPDLELVIGPQPPVLELGAQETQNRFNIYFQFFMQAISQADHPLVMFLDDLQWADMASLQALKTLFQAPDLTHLLIIGAYRDNEVLPSDPLLITIDEIAAAGIPVSAIALQPLAQEHVAQWIADTLRHEITTAQPLTNLVYEKTLGNPFFVRQFLQSLYEEGLLRCERRADEGRPSWQWDIERIRGHDMTDNVATLMVKNISKQPAAMQRTLQIAACIGNRFDAQTLAWATEESPQAAYQQLVQGIKAGFLAPLDEQFTGVAAADAQPHSLFRFMHDRIQQAASSMLSPEEQEQLHLNIGRLLLTHTPPDEREEVIFSLVNHLNQGRCLITDAAERLRVIELNLLAGKRAKQATAYQEAFDYLQIGLEMLPDTAWQTHYQLTYNLHTELIGCAYPTGQFDLVDRLVQAALKHARTDLEYAGVQSIQIHALTAQTQHEEAIEIGLQALARLGVAFPKNPTKLHILLAILRTQYHLRGKSMADLLEAPPLQDKKQIMALNIMWRTGHSMILSNPELFALNMQKGMVLSLKHGYLGLSGLLFTGHAIIVAEILRNYEQGVRLCELGLQIAEQHHDPVSYASSHSVFYGMMGHWHTPLSDVLPKLLETYRLGRAVGDAQIVSVSLFEYLVFKTYSGAPLAELAEQAEAFGKQIASMNQEYMLAYIRTLAQFIQNFGGDAEEPHRLKGDFVDGEIMRAHLEQMQDKACLLLLHSCQAILGYHFGRYDLALRESIQAQRYTESNMAMMTVSVLLFYDSLIRLAILPEASGKDWFSHHWAIRKNRKLLRKWAKVSPVNYAHKYELAEAEWYRYRHKHDRAHAGYQRAIALAKEQGLQWDLALGYELAGRFYHEQEQTELAGIFLRQAHRAYHAWGAAAKVQDLETRYPDIAWREAFGNEITTTAGHMSDMTWPSQTTSSYVLDWRSVVKAAQTLSGEINLETLLTQLMRMVLENAGAEHSYLFLPQGQVWTLEAEGHVERLETAVLQSAPLEKIERVPAAIIHYVARTQEAVVLRDATNEGRFTHDASIVKHRPTSVLCAPLVNQGQVTGILYLENNVTTGAFTPDSLEVLKFLASQAAISIENARLYDQLAQYNKTLEVKVAERTQALSQALDDLKAAQQDLIQSEKMAALGQLIAGIAHEINTPLGAIGASIGNISNALDDSMHQLPQLFQRLSPQQQQDFFALLERALHSRPALSSREERKFKRALSKELESQGIDEVDTVADTLVDMGIYEDVDAFLPLFQSGDTDFILKAAYNLSSQQKNSQNIVTAVERASKMVFALKRYIHRDPSGEMIEANITDGIEVVLTLYHNQIKHGVELVKKFQDVPAIRCAPDELNQVWTNLIHNALQAINYEGQLEIAVFQQNGQVVTQITDSGPGISEEIKERIFEPFFTTKPAGEGSGLGLDIVREIVEKHQGKMEVESQPGRTTFSVRLPIERNGNQ